MKRLLLPAALLLLAAPALLSAGPAAPVRPADEALADAMHGLKDNLKLLGSSLADPAKEETALAALVALQVHALKGKTLAPTNLDAIPPGRQEAHRRAFRADMARLLVELSTMEIDLLEGRREEALARLQGPLLELREASHERYQPQDG